MIHDLEQKVNQIYRSTFRYQSTYPRYRKISSGM
jgi:hypothetical protein